MSTETKTRAQELLDEVLRAQIVLVASLEHPVSEQTGRAFDRVVRKLNALRKELERE